MKYGFGVDLGGTTVKIAYFDENGTMLAKWEIPTVTENNGKQILPDIAASIKQYIQQKSGKTIINPGSVGIPQGGTVWPKYALIEIEAGAVSCSLHEVPYDMRNVICSQFDRGLVERAEYWAIGILYDIITGKECALRLLDSVAASGNVYDESSWYRAALQLGMRMTKDELISLCPEYTPSPC